MQKSSIQAPSPAGRLYAMDPWQIHPDDFPKQGSPVEQFRFLVRYAILAPSSHNTEPWKFSVCDRGVVCSVDRSRWLRKADRDQRELYISLGCALENLLIAAEHYGYGHQIEWFPEGEASERVAQVQLEADGQPSGLRPPELFSSITVRHTSHQLHESRAIAEGDLRKLRACCYEQGVLLHMASDARFLQRTAALVEQGDLIQFSDPAFRQELAGWIARGVFGTPWLTSKLYAMAVRFVNIGRTQARRDADLVGSSPVIGVLSSSQADPGQQVRVGQVFERLALTAASMGIWTQPMSQLLEVDQVRAELVRLLPPGRMVPQHAFRMGYGPAERRHTPRRKLEEVLVD